jgi:hypothetical protein
MSVAMRIECLDCGRSRGIPNVPLDGGSRYWKRFLCTSCKAEGGEGRNVAASKLERSDADRSFRADLPPHG